MALGPAHIALIALGAAIIAAPMLLSWLLRMADRPEEAIGQKLTFKAYEPRPASGCGAGGDGLCGDGGGDGGGGD